MNRRALLIAAIAAPLPLLATAQATSPQVLAGVRYEPTAVVGGQTLRLNGAGIRYKFVVKVYTLGMYLGTRAATPEEAIAAPGAKRLHVVMLRDVDGNELGKLFTRGIEQNSSRDAFVRLIPGTLQMSEIFSTRRKLVAGDSFSVDWLPGTGMVTLVNGQPVGKPILEPEFYAAMMRIWLGRSPADASLKEALLGRAQQLN